MIPFNIPYCTGKELHNIKLAIESKKICGNGYYTHLCQQFFENKFGFKKCLLTSSCTDALEMCAILANIKEGDEVIVPSYTFVSSALAFVRQSFILSLPPLWLSLQSFIRSSFLSFKKGYLP